MGQINKQMDDLVERLKKVDAIKTQVIRVYQQDELLGNREAMGLPLVGVVFKSVMPTGDHRTGLAARNHFELFIIGVELCDAEEIGSNETNKTITILEQIVDVIGTEKAPNQKRLWKFEGITMAMFMPEQLAYRMEWSAPVILT